MRRDVFIRHLGAVALAGAFPFPAGASTAPALRWPSPGIRGVGWFAPGCALGYALGVGGAGVFFAFDF